ncbi:MAG: DUF368 domain-containing protein [Pleomorphochaeta sp.]|jgi:putative membrane protein
MIGNSINGFCMALADSIPGVSGGTIAYILGFYDTLLESINNVFSKDKLQRKTALTFLIQLLIGWLIGFILSIIILSTLFTNHIYFMSSLLIGLTISSIPLIFFEEKNIFKLDAKSIIKYLVFFLIGFTLVILISTNASNNLEAKTDLTNINFYLGLKLVFIGILAISTMILPGISGSSLLVIFNLYIPIISAIKELLSFNFEYFLAILLFGCGILIGAITTVKIVKNALKKHRSSTICFILGLISAAIYSIILGPTSLDIPQEPLSFSTFNILAFLFGLFIILLLHKIKNKKIQ